MPIRLPQTRAEYSAFALAVSLIAHAVFNWLSGDYTGAAADFAGAFGTVGLPTLIGSGYHVEIREDQPR